MYYVKVWDDGKWIETMLVASCMISQAEDAVRKDLAARGVQFEEVTVQNVVFDQLDIAHLGEDTDGFNR